MRPLTDAMIGVRRAGGFSLVEIVVAIVITSIMSIGLVRFIITSSEGYVSTANRNQLSANGRAILDRISFEVHNALPNSIRIGSAAPNGDQCLEFAPVRAASTYVDAPFRMADDQFDTVEFVPDQTGASGIYAIIFPNNTNQLYQEPQPNRSPRAEVGSIAHNVDDTDTVTLTGNHRFRRRSPVQRVFLSDEPVSYCVDGGRLFRYSDYGWHSSQLEPGDVGFPASTPGRVLLADNIDNSGREAFDYLDASRRRNAVVQVELNFSEDGDEVTLNHEILLQSTP